MAYDPNFPFGYTPYYQQQQLRQQAQQNTYAFVSGLDGAKSFPLPTNQSMLLMDSEQSVCYLKQVNALGQMTLKCFKLVEINENDIKNQNVAQNVDYATKSDFQEVLKRLEKLEGAEKHE